MKQNRTIWKFPMNRLLASARSDEIIDLPIGAKILHVDLQNGIPCFWVEVDPEQPKKEDRHFSLVGTGFPYNPAGVDYIGTFQQPPFVWHVFEHKRRTQP